MDNDNLKSFLKPTQFSSDSPLYKRWTCRLVLCCLLASIASFQFGYSIGSLNIITPSLKDFFVKASFSPIDFKLENGIKLYLSKEEFYNEKKSQFEQRERQLQQAQWRRENYFDIMTSGNETAISETQEYLRNRTIEVKQKYNMTLEQFLPYAEKLLEEKRKELAEGREKLDAANQTIKLKTNKLNYYKSILSDMSGALSNLFFIIGGIIGACTSKYPIDKFGYKHAISFHYFFALLAELMVLIPFAMNSFLSPNLKFIKSISFLISRLLYGIQGGLSCTLVPSYINEIVPVGLRKSTGIFHSVFLSLGIFASHLVGNFSLYFNQASLFIVCCYVPLLTTIIGLILFMLFASNSPKAFIEDNKKSLALKELTKLRNVKEVNEELDHLAKEIIFEEEEDKLRFNDLLNTKSLKWPLFTSVLLHVTQQFSGINAIYFYSYLIFELIGLNKEEIKHAVLFVGFINLLSTVMISPLVHRVNKRWILILNLFIIVINFAALVFLIKIKDQFELAKYLSVGCIVTYLICFSASLGPIPFLYVNDVFQKDARSAPTFVCIITNWTCALLVALNFELMVIVLREYVFVVLASICFLTLAIFTFKVT